LVHTLHHVPRQHIARLGLYQAMVVVDLGASKPNS
jgi:hypothetical protein